MLCEQYNMSAYDIPWTDEEVQKVKEQVQQIVGGIPLEFNVETFGINEDVNDGIIRV